MLWRSRPPSPRGGFATLKPRWSLSQTKPGRLQSASRSVGPAGAAAQRARLHRRHSCRETVAHGVCPNVQPSRSRAKQALHSRTFRRAAVVQRKGEPGPITYCQPQKTTADPPPAWGSGPVVPWLQSARSLTNRGGVLESVASFARCGTQARFREQRRAVSGWDLGLGSG
jgi:hypothetical protein